jgi:hypothetical protein
MPGAPNAAGLILARRAAVPAGLAILALAGAAGAGRAQVGILPIDVELVLAIDVSRSVDWGEAYLQHEGYIRAFADPRRQLERQQQQAPPPPRSRPAVITVHRG